MIEFLIVLVIISLVLSMWLFIKRHQIEIPSPSQVIVAEAEIQSKMNKEYKKKRWCKNCEYCQDTSKPKVICKRYPFAQRVDRHYWCGEFKLK